MNINNKNIIRQPQKKAVGLLFRIKQATEIVDALTTLTDALITLTDTLIKLTYTLIRLLVALAKISAVSAVIYVIIF